MTFWLWIFLVVLIIEKPKIWPHRQNSFQYFIQYYIKIIKSSISYYFPWRISNNIFKTGTILLKFLSHICLWVNFHYFSLIGLFLSIKEFSYSSQIREHKAKQMYGIILCDCHALPNPWFGYGSNAQCHVGGHVIYNEPIVVLHLCIYSHNIQSKSDINWKNSFIHRKYFLNS